MKRLSKRTAVEQTVLPLPLPGGLVLGTLISYYLEGWYYGYLVSVNGGSTKVRPIVAGDAIPRNLSIPLDSVRAIEQKKEADGTT